MIIIRDMEAWMIAFPFFCWENIHDWNGDWKMANIEEELTFRQKALLELLKSDGDTFTKKTFVPKTFDQKMWKYTNSLVDGNCQWFGGNTARKVTKERQKVHHEELGFENKIRMIVHADRSHRTYRMNKPAIRQYLLATLSHKYNFDVLPNKIEQIEKHFSVSLRSMVGGME